MKSSIDIDVNEIRSRAKITRSCVFSNGFIIRPKLGRLVLDFSDLNASAYDFIFKRVSGNGDIIIEYIGYKSYHRISSKTSEIVYINSAPTNGIIEIQRPSASKGDIILIGIKCHLNDDIIRDDQLSHNWKKLIKRCGKYGGLRLSKGRLFAGNSGFISNSSFIKHIQTNPPNMYSIKGERITFLGACEIVDLKLLDGAVPKQPLTDLYVSRNPPTPEIVKETSQESNSIDYNNTNNFYITPKKVHNHYEEMLVYDSSASRQFIQSLILSNKFVKATKSNATNFIVLKRGGSFFIPMATLEPEMEYVVAVTSKKISGNGKVYIGFSTDKTGVAQGAQTLVCGPEMEEQFISIPTGKKTVTNQSFYLNLSMREDGNGESIFSRIRVLKGMKAFHSSYNESHVGMPKDSALDNSVIGKIDIGYDSSDSIFLLSKKYSRLAPGLKAKDVNQNIVGSIYSNTMSGMMWINKIKRIYPRINQLTSEKLISDDTITICSIENVPQSKKLWIEEFNNYKVNHDIIETIQKAEIVFSTSEANAQALEAETGCEVNFLPRLIPFVEPKIIPLFENTKFILSFNRSYNVARRIAESWTSDMPKIIMVGLRGRAPKHIIPINEYTSYEELMFLIQKAECILDLHTKSKDYESAFLYLANKMNKPIVTNNWFGMRNKNCIFSVSNDRMGEDLLPAPEQLNKEIKKTLKISLPRANMDSYNKELEKIIGRLFL